MISCQIQLFRGCAPQGPMLKIRQHAMCNAMPLLSRSFIFHACGQIVQALSDAFQAFLTNWLWLESVAAEIANAIALGLLRNLGDHFDELWIP